MGGAACLQSASTGKGGEAAGGYKLWALHAKHAAAGVAYPKPGAFGPLALEMSPLYVMPACSHAE